MNKNDRKEVSKWVGQLEETSLAIAEMEQDQEEKFDNMPEGLQESERGEELQNAIDNLQSAADSIDEAIGYLNELLT